MDFLLTFFPDGHISTFFYTLPGALNPAAVHPYLPRSALAMPPLLFSLRASPCSGFLLRRLLLFRCSASSATRSSSLAPYHASFARRMALAGIHPHHRIGSPLLPLRCFSHISFQWV